MRTEQRLEFFFGRRRRQPFQGKGRLYELVGVAVSQFGRIDFGHQSQVELFEVRYRQHFALPQQCEAAGQQMPVEQVADFIDGVGPLRAEVQVIARQFLPIETLMRHAGQPFQALLARAARES